MNIASLQLDMCSPLPEVHDDCIRTPAGQPAIVYPIGVEIDLAQRGWELTLLNDPQGGTATATSEGAVIFTPDDGFVGAATIHYLIEDQQHNDASATITVEVQNHFAFNTQSPTNHSTAAGQDPSDQSACNRGRVGEKIFSVVAEPLFAGTAAPLTEMMGRIYRQCGALAGESLVVADADGFWETSFPGTQALEFYRVEFHPVNAVAISVAKITLHANEGQWQSL